MYLENAVLYTFSTIPQTLGAAFAVLAAFVLYRFQGDAAVDRDIEEIMQMFSIAEQRQLLREAIEQGLRQLIDQMDLLFRNPSGHGRKKNRTNTKCWPDSGPRPLNQMSRGRCAERSLGPAW